MTRRIQNMCNRRDVLKAGTAGALALALPGFAVAKGKGAPKAGIAFAALLSAQRTAPRISTPH